MYEDRLATYPKRRAGGHRALAKRTAERERRGSDKVRAGQLRATEAQANALSVRLELQADCLAGVWAHRAHRAQQLLEEGDVEEGLRAAAAIGDDRLQAGAHGQVRPEAFTHGTSDQRVRWLRQGRRTGDIAQCDTFRGERS